MINQKTQEVHSTLNIITRSFRKNAYSTEQGALWDQNDSSLKSVDFKSYIESLRYTAKREKMYYETHIYNIALGKNIDYI